MPKPVKPEEKLKQLAKQFSEGEITLDDFNANFNRIKPFVNTVRLSEILIKIAILFMKPEFSYGIEQNVDGAYYLWFDSDSGRDFNTAFWKLWISESDQIVRLDVGEKNCTTITMIRSTVGNALIKDMVCDLMDKRVRIMRDLMFNEA